MFLPLGPKSDPILCGRRAEIAQPACDLPASHKRAFPALTPPTLETPSHHQASPGSSDLAGDDWGGMRRAAFLPVPPRSWCRRCCPAPASPRLGSPLRLQVLSALKNLQTHENAVVKLQTWAAIIGGNEGLAIPEHFIFLLIDGVGPLPASPSGVFYPNSVRYLHRCCESRSRSRFQVPVSLADSVSPPPLQGRETGGAKQESSQPGQAEPAMRKVAKNPSVTLS